MKKSIIIIILLVFSLKSFANEGPIENSDGGRIKFLDGEHKSIQMLSERIDMYIDQMYYKVTVVFYFYNHGEATDLKMGFPEYVEDYMGRNYDTTQSLLYKFTSTVNGKKVQLRKEVSVDTAGKTGHIYNFVIYHTKTVHFNKHERKTITIQYYSDNIGGITYTFTGGGWYGKVNKSTLVVHPMFPCNSNWGELKEKEGFSKKSGKNFVFEWKNWEAEYKFTIFGSFDDNCLSYFNDFKSGKIVKVFKSGYYTISNLDFKKLYKSPKLFSKISEVYFHTNFYYSVLAKNKLYFLNLKKSYKPIKVLKIANWLDDNNFYQPPPYWIGKSKIGKYDCYYILRMKLNSNSNPTCIITATTDTSEYHWYNQKLDSSINCLKSAPKNTNSIAAYALQLYFANEIKDINDEIEQLCTTNKININKVKRIFNREKKKILTIHS